MKFIVLLALCCLGCIACGSTALWYLVGQTPGYLLIAWGSGALFAVLSGWALKRWT